MDPEQDEAIANEALSLMVRIATALERLADADERRNELHAADSDQRQAMFDADMAARREQFDIAYAVEQRPLSLAEQLRVNAAEEEARDGR